MSEVKHEAKENFGDSVDIDIKETIDFESMLEFVQEVTVNSFDDEGDYIPEVTDFLIKVNVIKRYTNFDMPEDISDEYYLIYNTDLFNNVSENINKIQFSEIVNSIDRKIKYMCDGNISQITNELNKMFDNFHQTQKITEKILDGVSEEDMSNLIKAISSGNLFNEDKIVESYIKHTNKDIENVG